MSAWPSSQSRIARGQRTPPIVGSGHALRRLDSRTALWLGCLICLLGAQGVAVAHSYLWAAPLLCLLIVACATDLPLIPFLGAILLVRVVTDASVSTHSAGSGSVNLSGDIAVLLILVGIGLLVRRRQGVTFAVLAALWLCLWTVIALRLHGASVETVRQGVREGAVVALAIIVCNSRRVITVPVATRLVQFLGFVPALIALYQLATHTGLNTEGHIRAYGTFNHPDGAAMFFAIAATASLWQYMDNGRRRSDLLLTALYSAATVTTFSLTGLVSLLAMLMTFGVLRPGSVRIKLGSFTVAALIVIGFLATPYGAARLASESSTHLASGQTRTLASTSLGWRIFKWGTLIPEWEAAPFFGKGLGTTVTTEGNFYLSTAGKAPHNEYLRYLVETGVVGLGLLLSAVAILIRRLMRIRRATGGLAGSTLGIAIVVGCLVDAVADNTFLYTTTGYAVALILGAILSGPKNEIATTGTMRRASKRS
jgi:O-antigen ligase